MAELVEWRTITGATVVVGETEVDLEARTLALRLPFGGAAWSWPAAITVRRQGKTERIPVHDLTRIINTAMLACTLILPVFAAVSRSARKQHRNK